MNKNKNGGKSLMTNKQAAALIEVIRIIAETTDQATTLKALERIKQELTEKTAPEGDPEAVKSTD